MTAMVRGARGTAWGRQVAHIDYVFDDPSIRFIGRCDDGPVFYLFGGDYASDARQFS